MTITTMRVDLDRYGAFDLSPAFLRRQTEIHGKAAEIWLDTLAERVTGVLRQLDATIGTRQPDLSYNLVLFVTTNDGFSLVTKFSVPSGEFEQEVIATTALSLASGPEVVYVDHGSGVLVMERILPGTSLSEASMDRASDVKTTEAVAALACDIHERIDPSALTSQLPDMRRWTQALETVDSTSLLWDRHRDLIQRAVSIRNRLLDHAQDVPAFLHGDLHHENVLEDASGSVRPIDPKGVIGPPAFEIGAFLLNPWGIADHPDVRQLTERRIDTWSRITHIAPVVLREWGVVAAVVSACWSAEDHGEGWNAAIRLALLLEHLRLER
jgi:streptomycin 6-kinase